MSHQSVERVTGMKKFKGEIEGKLFDSTSMFIETRMDDRQGNQRGHCTMSFKAGTSEVFDKLSSIPLPAEFEVDWATVTNGNRSQQIITGIRPHKPGQAKPTAS